MGLVVLILVFLTLGIVEFGRMLMLLNIITNATRDGARAAATIGKTGRAASNSQLCPAAQTSIKNIVVGQLNGYVTISTSDVGISYPVPGAGQPQTVRITTTVGVKWIALPPWVGKTLTITRTVSFRDEVRSGGTGC